MKMHQNNIYILFLTSTHQNNNKKHKNNNLKLEKTSKKLKNTVIPF
jgi:hypothetical protein